MRIFILIIILLIALKANAQTYFVSKVAGVVLNNNIPVKAGDQLTSVTSLTSVNPGSMLRLISAKSGVLILSFYNGSEVIKSTGNKSQEVYELVIKDYIEKYSKYKSLSTKSFELRDWFDCLIGASVDSINHKLLIVADEKIGLHTRNFNPAQSYVLLACRYGQDSLCEQIPIVSDSLDFSQELFKSGDKMQMKFKIVDYSNVRAKDTLTITDSALDCTVLSKTAVSNLANQFRDMKENTNQPDGDVEKDLYDFIRFTFGSYFSSYVDKLIISSKKQ